MKNQVVQKMCVVAFSFNLSTSGSMLFMHSCNHMKTIEDCFIL